MKIHSRNRGKMKYGTPWFIIIPPSYTYLKKVSEFGSIRHIREDVAEWLDENTSYWCCGYYKTVINNNLASRFGVIFKKDEDALLFKLRWADEMVDFN